MPSGKMGSPVCMFDRLQAVRVRNQVRLQRAVGQLMRSPGVLLVLTALVGISHCDTASRQLDVGVFPAGAVPLRDPACGPPGPYRRS